jgi:glycosyltransferase involved in cell wall biosynthesis
MKVFFVALGIYSRTGGMEAFNRRVVRSLAEIASERRWSVTVLSLWDRHEDAAKAPASVRFVPGCAHKTKTALDFVYRSVFGRPDVILYGHVLLASLALLARVMNVRSRQLLFVHGTEVWGDPEFRRIPKWEPALVRHSFDGVVSVSKLTQHRMLRAFGMPPERFHLLPNAVDEDPATLSSPLGGGNRLPVLLSVCRLGLKDRYKGVDKVIRAMPQILRFIPNARYWIVGEGPLRSELERLAANCGVSDRVHFFGYVDDDTLRRLYSQAQVFILPSTGEGFGIVFLEAWQHGLPVICGCRDASAEVVSHGVNGLTVEPTDISAIADAALRLLSDAALRARLGLCGWHLVKSFSHAVFRQRLGAILDEHAPRRWPNARENPQTAQPLSARRG